MKPWQRSVGSRLLERVRRYREKRGKAVTRNANEVEVVTPEGERYEYDREKYPVFKAWQIAVERAMRAKRYAEKFRSLFMRGT